MLKDLPDLHDLIAGESRFPDSVNFGLGVRRWRRQSSRGVDVGEMWVWRVWEDVISAK